MNGGESGQDRESGQQQVQQFQSHRLGPMRILASEMLHKEDLSQIVDCLRRTGLGERIGGGRSPVRIIELRSGVKVALKSYTRGGVLGWFVRHLYLGFGAPRGESELLRLRHLQELGIPVPEPLAAVTQGRRVYRTWLVTQYIENSVSLAALAATDEERARLAVRTLAGIFSTLVQSRVFHVDLHPGNVLVRDDDRVFVLDFDKAVDFRGSLNALRDGYLVRWRRACLKHGLPEFLSEELAAGLRHDFSRDAERVNSGCVSSPM